MRHRHAHDGEHRRRPSQIEQLAGTMFDSPVLDPHWLVAPLSPLEHRFAEFHAQNPGVYSAMERAALHLLKRGERRIGIALIAEELRHNPELQTAGDPFKVNNSYRALYARLLIHRNPELGAVMEVRERTENERGVA